MDKQIILTMELIKAEISVMAEIAELKHKIFIPDDNFEGVVVEGYEYAFLELEAKTKLQKNICENINMLSHKTIQFKDGYDYAISNIEQSNCSICADELATFCPYHD